MPASLCIRLYVVWVCMYVMWSVHVFGGYVGMCVFIWVCMYVMWSVDMICEYVGIFVL